MTICVFGGARDEVAPVYFELAEALGRELARRGHTLLFGAGAHGMMGAAARGAAAEGGNIIGVVPDFFDMPGVLYENCTEQVRTETMAQRKAYMREHSDAFIALPGGIGTMEEILEVLTLKLLGRTEKKAAFLDAEGYWQSLLAALNAAADRGFAGEDIRGCGGYFTDAAACLDWLEEEA